MSNRVSFSAVLLFSSTILTISCQRVEDPVQKERLEQLFNFCHEQKIELQEYSYVIVSGDIRCLGCEELWLSKLVENKSIQSNGLLISSDNHDLAFFEERGISTNKAESLTLTEAFPYLTNYFLFYRNKEGFDAFVELGSRNIAIPASSK